MQRSWIESERQQNSMQITKKWFDQECEKGKKTCKKNSHNINNSELRSLGICVSLVGEHISLELCVSLVGEHISLGICVSLVGEHISLGICVSLVGNTYHKGYVFNW